MFGIAATQPRQRSGPTHDSFGQNPSCDADVGLKTFPAEDRLTLAGTRCIMTEDLILINEQNRAVGRAEKHAVHAAGLLHRAFSIFLVDAQGQLLLQRRSRSKYHSAGLWANSCCGHPRPGESTLRAARRRLGEELGASTSLRFGFQARYRTALPNGLIENELVYVDFGMTPEHLSPNPDEVSGVGRMSLAALRADIARRPQRYTYWLRYYLKNHYDAIRRGLDDVRRSDRKPNRSTRLVLAVMGSSTQSPDKPPREEN